MLNPELLKDHGNERFIHKGGTGLTWADIDGRILRSNSKELPAKRVCGIHAYFSIRVGHIQLKWVALR